MSNSTRRMALWLVIGVELFAVLSVAFPILTGKADSQSWVALIFGALLIGVSVIFIRRIPKEK